MHLNERLEKSREALGQQLAVGQQKVSSAYNRLWAEMEALREAQKKRQEEARLAAEKEGKVGENGAKCESTLSTSSHTTSADKTQGTPKSPDLSNAQANLQAASTRASAYFSSWGTWASEKRKGWGNKTPVSSPPPSAGPTALPADIKRAEAFEQAKRDVVGDVKTPAPSTEIAEVKRESLFFDAEKEGR